mmetsp:Transcript_11681/g.41723  ORF Transcript_11681/g.41723 Transcript_11681/m.41723 type:complete len:435 (-) Transcript_11681:867-2171(-)
MPRGGEARAAALAAAEVPHRAAGLPGLGSRQERQPELRSHLRPRRGPSDDRLQPRGVLRVLALLAACPPGVCDGSGRPPARHPRVPRAHLFRHRFARAFGSRQRVCVRYRHPEDHGLAAAGTPALRPPGHDGQAAGAAAGWCFEGHQGPESLRGYLRRHRPHLEGRLDHLQGVLLCRQGQRHGLHERAEFFFQGVHGQRRAGHHPTVGQTRPQPLAAQVSGDLLHPHRLLFEPVLGELGHQGVRLHGCHLQLACKYRYWRGRSCRWHGIQLLQRVLYHVHDDDCIAAALRGGYREGRLRDAQELNLLIIGAEPGLRGLPVQAHGPLLLEHLALRGRPVHRHWPRSRDDARELRETIPNFRGHALARQYGAFALPGIKLWREFQFWLLFRGDVHHHVVELRPLHFQPQAVRQLQAVLQRHAGVDAVDVQCGGQPG